jgi:hypothetical protein
MRRGWQWSVSIPLVVVVASMVAGASSTAATKLDLLPPVFTTPGGFTRTPALVGMTNPNASGAIFYTADGSDPCGPFGEVIPHARRYIAHLSVTHSQIIRARIKSGTNWSDLAAVAFTADQDFSKLLFTEVMYHPTDSMGHEREEFVEFKNVGTKPLDVSGLDFAELNGLPPYPIVPPFFTFPPRSIIPPGGFLILAPYADVFQGLYPGVLLHGEFTHRGAGLNERDGHLALVANGGAVATRMRYWTHSPWPVLPDNHGYFVNEDSPVGFSLVRTTLDPAADPEDFRTWRASTHRLGSPGADDPPPIVQPIYVNELLTRSNGAILDTVELYNPNSTDVHLGGWRLSDGRTRPYAYQIPQGMMIPALGFLLLDEADFNTGPNGFSFSSDMDRCYLFSGDTNGKLTGYSHGLEFLGSDRNVSFGRNRSSTGADYWLPEISRTFEAANSGPQIPALMITEVMYQADANGARFIELRNSTGGPLHLWDPQNPEAVWRVGNLLPWGDFDLFDRAFIFPPNATVPAEGYVLLVVTDPATFRSTHGIPNDVLVFQLPAFFGLSDVSGKLSVHRPSGTQDGGGPRYVVIDELQYNNQWPWDPGAAGGGQSLEKLNLLSFGSEPANWRACPTGSSPGRDNSGNLPPQVSAGGDRTAFLSKPADIVGFVSDDHWLGSTLLLSWIQVSGPSVVQFEGNALASTTVRFSEAGSYVLRLSATDGVHTAVDDTTVDVIARPIDAWRSAIFTAAELTDDLVSGPSGDPDHDGLTNLAEYFFATPPKEVDSHPLRARIVDGHLEITWLQREDSPEVVAELERADRMEGPWFAGPGLFRLVESEIAAEGLKRITFRSLLPLTVAAQQFARLRLALIDD